jgi:hypothetical protein
MDTETQADVRLQTRKGPRKQRRFTVEVEYLLPVYQTVQVTAANSREACKKALELAGQDWSGATQDYETSSGHYVSGIIAGHHDNIHEGGGAQQPIAKGTGIRAAIKDWGRVR